jgi:hypothetical protein
MESPDPNNPGLIMGPGPEGCWDSERVSGPRVLRRQRWCVEDVVLRQGSIL